MPLVTIASNFASTLNKEEIFPDGKLQLLN